jgi:hypothetical protein
VENKQFNFLQQKADVKVLKSEFDSEKVIEGGEKDYNMNEAQNDIGIVGEAEAEIKQKKKSLFEKKKRKKKNRHVNGNKKSIYSKNCCVSNAVGLIAFVPTHNYIHCFSDFTLTSITGFFHLPAP